MIVVTGATGNVGRQLVRVLVAAGEKVTAVSRQPLPTDLPGDTPGDVRQVKADLTDPESLRPALDGAEALFLIVAGGAPQDLVGLAEESGMRRIVLLSSQGAGTRPKIYRHPRDHEDAVRSSSLEWTILRPGGFASNTFAWAETVRAQRLVTAPFGDVELPVIDPADIADVAAAALRDPAHAGRVYDLTGPKAMSPRARADVLAETLGEPVRFDEQSPAEARTQMLRVMPEPVVDGTLTILGEPLPEEQRVSPDIELVLGRPPRTFADWVARNLAAFH